MIKICEYSEDFLDLSWKWLNDPEIKELTMTPDFTKEEQVVFFNNLKCRKDYKIFGLEINNVKIGACGIKNIKNGMGEYWGYIGEKDYWGKGLGKDILNKLIDIATYDNLSYLYLKVEKENVRARKLYEKLGFAYKSEEFNYFIMDKSI